MDTEMCSALLCQTHQDTTGLPCVCPLSVVSARTESQPSLPAHMRVLSVCMHKLQPRQWWGEARGLEARGFGQVCVCVSAASAVRSRLSWVTFFLGG